MISVVGSCGGNLTVADSNETACLIAATGIFGFTLAVAGFGAAAAGSAGLDAAAAEGTGEGGVETWAVDEAAGASDLGTVCGLAAGGGGGAPPSVIRKQI